MWMRQDQSRSQHITDSDPCCGSMDEGISTARGSHVRALA